MKLAWLCYEYDDDVDDRETGTYNPDRVIIVFEEPSKYKYASVKRIVYAEIENDKHC